MDNAGLVSEAEHAVAVFFRDPWLADHIGFHYQRYADYAEAAREVVAQIKDRYIGRLRGEADRVLTVVLDGENAWSTYREDARAFPARIVERAPAKELFAHPLHAYTKGLLESIPTMDMPSKSLLK